MMPIFIGGKEIKKVSKKASRINSKKVKKTTKKKPVKKKQTKTK
jgi:hypothetical protein